MASLVGARWAAVAEEAVGEAVGEASVEASLDAATRVFPAARTTGGRNVDTRWEILERARVRMAAQPKGMIGGITRMPLVLRDISVHPRDLRAWLPAM